MDVLTGAASLISHLCSGSARAKAFALFGTVNGLGLAAGPAVPGLLLSAWGWRGIFAAHTIVLLLALLGSLKLPVLGRGRTSLRDLLDFSALRAPKFLAMTLVPVVGAIGFVTFLTYLPSALGAIYTLPAGATGALMLVMTIPVLAAPAIVHRLMQRTDVTAAAVVMASFGFLIIGGLGVAVLLRQEMPIPLSVAPMVLLGLGFGLPLGFVDTEALSAVPTDRSGAASGVINLFRVGSEAVFVAVYAVILMAAVTATLPGPGGSLTASGTAGHPDAYQSGLRIAALSMVAIVCVIALLFARLARMERNRRMRCSGGVLRVRSASAVQRDRRHLSVQIERTALRDCDLQLRTDL